VGAAAKLHRAESRHWLPELHYSLAHTGTF
jgi:hypothetical protein